MPLTAAELQVGHDERLMYKLYTIYQFLCRCLAPAIAGPFVLMARYSHRMRGEITQPSILVSRIPFTLGERTRWWYYRAVLDAVGEDVTIKYGAVFQYRRARIGQRVLIGYFNTLGEVEIGDDVLLGGNITVLSGLAQHAYHDPALRIWDTPAPGRRQVKIGTDVWVGSGSIIGNDIGDRCVVAAGSVVVKPVASHTLVGGNPAKAIRTIP